MRILIATASELNFSVVSFAEIGIKAAIGKLDAPPDLHDHHRERANRGG